MQHRYFYKFLKVHTGVNNDNSWDPNEVKRMTRFIKFKNKVKFNTLDQRFGAGGGDPNFTGAEIFVSRRGSEWSVFKFRFDISL